MNDVVSILSKIVLTIIPQTSVSTYGFISMPIIVMVMVLCSILPFIFLYLLKANNKEVRVTDPWGVWFYL